MKNKVTGELVRSSAQHLRRTAMSEARAEALAREVERLNNAALAAAADSDFNDEPSRFGSTLVKLKAPGSRR